MQPSLRTAHVNGVRLAYVERGVRRDDLPTLFFVHATGFHARLWDYQAEAFPDHHIIALDQRGHGRSDAVAVDHWRTFGEDQAAFVQALGLERLIGVGHSMGGHGMIDAAAKSGAFARLLLLDPTVASPASYAEGGDSLLGEGLHPAARRRAVFSSVEEMMDRLREKSSFGLFHQRIFSDYCTYGLGQTANGEFELLCPPTAEAAVYMTSRRNGAVYDSVHALEIPVTIVRADEPTAGDEHNFSKSPTWPGLVGEFSNARELHWSDCTHFIPMQRPDDVIALIRDDVEAWLRDR